jgi:hypothetical protein
MDTAKDLYAAAALAGQNRRAARRSGNKIAELRANMEQQAIRALATALGINPMDGR